MRRILSILLTLGLALGSALSAVPASALTGGVASGWTGKVQENNLPACCRRNGKHHCAMGTASGSSGETSVSATECCPCLPHALASTAPASATLPLTATTALAPRATHAIAVGVDSFAPANILRTWPKRGPPSTLIG